MRGHRGERIRQGAAVLCGGQNGIARRLDQLGGAALVHHLEMRRDPRFQRKAAEQRFAEAVDGLDLEAARRLQHLGKESAGALAGIRSEEHTSELQSLMRISYAVFCLKKK